MKIPLVLKNAFALFSSQIYNKIIAVIFFVIAARLLGVSGFGTYTLILTFISFFYIISDWGLSTLTIRDVARSIEQTRHYLLHTIPFRIILAGIFYLILLAVSFSLSYSKETIILISIAGLSLFTNTILGAFNAVFSAHEKMHVPSIMGIIFSTLFVLFGSLCLFLNYGLTALMIIFASLNLFNAIATGWLLRKYLSPFQISFDYALCKKLLMQASPYGFMSALSIVYFRIDTVILSKFQTIESVGLYNSAYKIVDFLMFMPVCYMGACFPQMSRQIKQDKSQLIADYKKITKTLLLAILPIAILCALFANFIISALYGNLFLPSARALRILIWAVVVMYISAPLGNIIYSSDKLAKFIPFAVLNTLLNIILNLIVIPKWNYIGASYITVITEITSLAIQIILIKKIIFKPRAF